METMYDKLGDLLNETLEAGAVKFVRIERTEQEEAEQEPQKPHVEAEAEQEPERKETPPKPRRVIYKKLSPELERAYRLLDITVSASADDVKKAYKEKLKYFHPDHYAGNAVLEKVATTKTREVVKAYNDILEFLKA